MSSSRPGPGLPHNLDMIYKNLDEMLKGIFDEIKDTETHDAAIAALEKVQATQGNIRSADRPRRFGGMARALFGPWPRM